MLVFAGFWWFWVVGQFRISVFWHFSACRGALGQLFAMRFGV